MVSLRPMTGDEYHAYERRNFHEYVEARARALHTSVKEEREVARRQIDALLTDGLATPGHNFWHVVTEEGQVVGDLWAQVDEEHARAFIFDIWLAPEHRGKGLGAQTLDVLEAFLRPRGIKRIGLNVFANNDVAMRLYQKQGYRVTNSNMQKDL